MCGDSTAHSIYTWRVFSLLWLGKCYIAQKVKGHQNIPYGCFGAPPKILLTLALLVFLEKFSQGSGHTCQSLNL